MERVAKTRQAEPAGNRWLAFADPGLLQEFEKSWKFGLMRSGKECLTELQVADPI
jgi:hypothetical protein